MGDKDQTTPSDSTDEGRPAGRRAASRRPFWRRGWFWLAVIGVEVALALALSFSFERSSTEVDLGGGDLAAFCAQAGTLRDQGFGTSSAGEGGGTAVDDPTRFIAEREAYRALVATAPPDLVIDLEELAEASDELVATAEDIGARKAADPSYSGLEQLDEALRRASVEHKVAAARVTLVLREQCAIGRGAGGTTTTAAPTVAVPGTPPP